MQLSAKRTTTYTAIQQAFREPVAAKNSIYKVMATIIIDVICEQQTTEVTTRKLKNPKAPKETGKIKGEATKRGRGKAKPSVQKESGLAVEHENGMRRERK